MVNPVEAVLDRDPAAPAPMPAELTLKAVEEEMPPLLGAERRDMEEADEILVPCPPAPPYVLAARWTGAERVKEMWEAWGA